MDRTDFIVSLAKYRMVKDAVNHGVPHSIAVVKVDAILREAHLTGAFAEATVMMLPDHATVLMVEHYMATLDSLERSGMRDHERMQAQAAGQIELGRGRIVPGLPKYPTDLTGYITYRHELEVPVIMNQSASSIGLDRETIGEQIMATLAYMKNGDLLLAA